MLRLSAVLLLALLAGCASTDQLRGAQGSGEKRTYGVSYERAWNRIPYAIVSKGTLSINISGADWTTKIFAGLDRQLKP